MTMISQGKITTPVSYFDVALPSGFIGFRLTMKEITLSALDVFCFAFSKDGGSTFYNDTVNFDTYGVIDWYATSTGQGLVPNLANANDSLGYVSYPDIGAGGAISADIFVDPGRSQQFPPYMRADCFITQGGFLVRDDCTGFLSPGATISPAYAPVNLIRFLPFGNGDCDPPTSAETINSGSWTLFGIPAP